MARNELGRAGHGTAGPGMARLGAARQGMNKKKRREYDTYLRSVKWRERRKRILERDNYTCRRCGSNGRPGNELTVHHARYENFGEERNTDLLTLCLACHSNAEWAKRFEKGKP